ncbi:hypothetical protein [Prauserella alba]|uniref:NUDIX domain-containing protein n=1 Tax=Prauserella alba TaxID=176898 RepID=A0ABP4G5S8_9PSEU|nr:hypothetical protein [Prauserella alba]MCP2182127.1 hypothetical protein [Prauserella alba]
MNATDYPMPADGHWRIRAHLVIHAHEDTSGEAHVAVVRSEDRTWVLPGGPVDSAPVKRSLLEHVRNQAGVEVPDSALSWVGTFEIADDPNVLVLVWETSLARTMFSTNEDCQWGDYADLRQPPGEVTAFDTDATGSHSLAHLIPARHP